jgi:hypothetical protein
MAIEGSVWSPAVVSLTRNSPAYPSQSVVAVTVESGLAKLVAATVIWAWLALALCSVKWIITSVWLSACTSTKFTPAANAFRLASIVAAIADAFPLIVMGAVTLGVPGMLSPSQFSLKVPTGAWANVSSWTSLFPPSGSPAAS